MRRQPLLPGLAVEHREPARDPRYIQSLVFAFCAKLFVDQSLAKDMQFFGQIHTDKHDDVTGFSCMTPLSDLTGSEGEEVGRFHFITRGFYVNLDPLVNVFFSGRLLHGGTAPLSPPGQSPRSWALRCVLIAYPAGAIVSGGARHALAAMPFREPLYISPEMTGVKWVGL